MLPKPLRRKLNKFFFLKIFLERVAQPLPFLYFCYHEKSFHPLLAMVEQFDDCCWISIDYCGRGNSDQLPTSEQYAFSKYLADTQDLIETLIQSQKQSSSRKFHLIGTSMGGILAMHLVNRLNHKVDSVVLNDIGFYLQWSALMSLYQNIKKSDGQMIELNVDARAIEDVQRSSHFDLHYQRSIVVLSTHQKTAEKSIKWKK